MKYIGFFNYLKAYNNSFLFVSPVVATYCVVSGTCTAPTESNVDLASAHLMLIIDSIIGS